MIFNAAEISNIFDISLPAGGKLRLLGGVKVISVAVTRLIWSVYAKIEQWKVAA